jgi:hypothetical protein
VEGEFLAEIGGVIAGQSGGQQQAWALPAESRHDWMKRTGLPRASTLTLIFVLRPPRERPIAARDKINELNSNLRVPKTYFGTSF